MTSNLKKASISIFWVIILIVGIVAGVLVYTVFNSLSEPLSTEGNVFKTLGCYVSNTISSYGLLRDVGVHIPKFLCEPSHVNINASECDCEDFDAFLSTKHPIENIEDNSTSTHASVLAKEGRGNLNYELKFWPVNLTSFKFYTNSSLQPSRLKITIESKGEGFFSSWQECASETIQVTGGYKEILAGKRCELMEEGKMRVTIDTLNNDDTELNIPEINMSFSSSGSSIPTKSALSLPPNVEESKKRYSYICKQDMVDGECSEEWKKKWVALKLGKLASQCWKMGLEGTRQPGAFPCFGGKITGISGSVASGGRSLMSKVASASEKAYIEKDDMTYREYLPRSRLAHNCPDFIPYVREPGAFTSWLIPSFANKNVDHGYRNYDHYSIVYADAHALSILWSVQNPGGDQIVFC